MFETIAPTKKLYYLDQYTAFDSAKIVGMDEGYVVWDQTILYPEGGGQESDTGVLETPAGRLHIVCHQAVARRALSSGGFQWREVGRRHYPPCCTAR